MQSIIRIATAGGVLALVLAAWGIAGAAAAQSYDLTFSGDASFHGAHGGQPIHVAVVETDGDRVVALASGTVSKSDDPAFSFDFPGALMAGKSYEVDYWIDSNFGGGSTGTCDAKGHDHQWRVALGTVSGNLDHTEMHRPAETTDVCDVFRRTDQSN